MAKQELTSQTDKVPFSIVRQNLVVYQRTCLPAWPFTLPDIGGEPSLSATLRFLGSFFVH
jgi:hypothetical protein